MAALTGALLVLSACSSESETYSIEASIQSVSSPNEEDKVNVVYEVENTQDFSGGVECDLRSIQENGLGVSAFHPPLEPGETLTEDVNFDVRPEMSEELRFDIACSVVKS